MQRKIVQMALLIMMFSSVIVIHEFGHFIMAQLFHVPVTKFQIGFGPSIFTIGTWLGTTFSLGPIPLGGYNELGDGFKQASTQVHVLIDLGGMLFSILFLFFLVGIVFGRFAEKILQENLSFFKKWPGKLMKGGGRWRFAFLASFGAWIFLVCIIVPSLIRSGKKPVKKEVERVSIKVDVATGTMTEKTSEEPMVEAEKRSAPAGEIESWYHLSNTMGNIVATKPGFVSLSIVFYLLCIVMNSFNLIPISPLDGGHATESMLRVASPWLADQYRTWTFTLFLFIFMRGFLRDVWNGTGHLVRKIKKA
ncbi:MAG: site-2 protease family protein [Candidatus Uhrbacteria bacterium]|nr:site-2 protease family protein [Candidatus Uhrbacteria bacterium]